MRCAELGLTLSDVSRLAGRNQSWLYDVFESKRVQTKTIHHLAKALQVPTAYFFAVDNRNGSDTEGR
jgi:transcriptional regulator with XRE-family HTH domain